jgi:hypothetical protein
MSAILYSGHHLAEYRHNLSANAPILVKKAGNGVVNGHFMSVFPAAPPFFRY